MTSPGPATPSRARPLAGARVLVTRAREQAPELSLELRRLGADVVEAPVIRFSPPRSWSRVDRSLYTLSEGSYAWVVLTSANGVRFFFDRLAELGIDFATVRSTKVAAVGPGTAAALLAREIEPSLIPESFTTEAVGLAFPRGTGRVLLARADVTEPGLEEALAERGWSPEGIVLYRLLSERRIENAVKRMITEGEIDVVTLASGGTVRAFIKLLGAPLPDSVRLACIGPVTARIAEEMGLRVDAVAAEHTIRGLAEAAAAAVAAGSPGSPEQR